MLFLLPRFFFISLLIVCPLPAHAQIFHHIGPSFNSPEGVYRVAPQLRNITLPEWPTITIVTTYSAGGSFAPLFESTVATMAFYVDMINARGGLVVAGAPYRLACMWSTDDSSIALANIVYAQYARNLTTHRYIVLGPIFDDGVAPVIDIIRPYNGVFFVASAANSAFSGYDYILGGSSPVDTYHLPGLKLWYARVDPLTRSRTLTVCMFFNDMPLATSVCRGANQFLRGINTTSPGRITYLRNTTMSMTPSLIELVAALDTCPRVDLLIVCMPLDQTSPSMLFKAARQSRVQADIALHNFAQFFVNITDPDELEGARPWISFNFLDMQSTRTATLPGVVFSDIWSTLSAYSIFTNTQWTSLTAYAVQALEVLTATLSITRSLDATDMRAAWLALNGSTFLSPVSINPDTGSNDAFDVFSIAFDEKRLLYQRRLRTPSDFPYPAAWPWSLRLMPGDPITSSLESSGALVGVVLAVIGSWVAQLLFEQAVYRFRRSTCMHVVWLLAVSITLGLVGTWSSLLGQIGFFNVMAQSSSLDMRFSLYMVLLATVPAFCCTYIGMLIALHQVDRSSSTTSATSSTLSGSTSSLDAASARALTSPTHHGASSSTAAPSWSTALSSMLRGRRPGALAASPIATTNEQRVLRRASIAANSAMRKGRERSTSLALRSHSSHASQRVRRREAQQRAMLDLVAHWHFVMHQFNVYSVIGGVFVAAGIILTRLTLLHSIVTNASWSHSATATTIAIVFCVVLSILSVHWCACAIRLRPLAALLFTAALFVDLLVSFNGLAFTYTGSELTHDTSAALYSHLVGPIAVKLMAGIFAALACLGFVGLQFSRMRLSRNDLALLTARLEHMVRVSRRQLKASFVANSALGHRVQRYATMLDLINLMQPAAHASLMSLALAAPREPTLSSLEELMHEPGVDVNEESSVGGGGMSSDMAPAFQSAAAGASAVPSIMVATSAGAATAPDVRSTPTPLFVMEIVKSPLLAPQTRETLLLPSSQRVSMVELDATLLPGSLASDTTAAVALASPLSDARVATGVSAGAGSASEGTTAVSAPVASGSTSGDTAASARITFADTCDVPTDSQTIPTPTFSFDQPNAQQQHVNTTFALLHDALCNADRPYSPHRLDPLSARLRKSPSTPRGILPVAAAVATAIADNNSDNGADDGSTGRGHPDAAGVTMESSGRCEENTSVRDDACSSNININAERQALFAPQHASTFSCNPPLTASIPIADQKQHQQQMTQREETESAQRDGSTNSSIMLATHLPSMRIDIRAPTPLATIAVVGTLSTKGVSSSSSSSSDINNTNNLNDATTLTSANRRGVSVVPPSDSSATTATTAMTNAAPLSAATEAAANRAKELRAVLAHPVCAEFFKLHMVRLHSEECVIFYLAVQHYRRLRTGRLRRTMAGRIIDLFLHADSPYQINVSQSLRRQLEGQGGGGANSVELFDAAEHEMQVLMLDNGWPSFVKSDLYTMCKVLLRDVPVPVLTANDDILTIAREQRRIAHPSTRMPCSAVPGHDDASLMTDSSAMSESEEGGDR